MAVYFSFLKPGDTILGMDLSHGGHLSHGAPVTFSGRLYKAVTYGVDRQSEEVDFAVVRELARKHRPKMIIAGASAYPRTLEFSKFAEIAREVGAYLMVDMAHIAGLIAGGSIPIPCRPRTSSPPPLTGLHRLRVVGELPKSALLPRMP